MDIIQFTVFIIAALYCFHLSEKHEVLLKKYGFSQVVMGALTLVAADIASAAIVAVLKALIGG